MVWRWLRRGRHQDVDGTAAGTEAGAVGAADPGDAADAAGDSRWATANGVRLHYRVLGPPDGRPVVWLHGMLGHAREWDVAVEDLAETHRVWVLDQRGHGRSGWTEDYSTSLMADDLTAWCDAVGLAEVDVVGHSMGARVALLAASRRPDLVRRLVLLDAGLNPSSSQMTEYLQEYLEMVGSASYRTVAEALHDRAGGPRARQELVRHYVEHALVRGEDGRYRWGFDAAGLVAYLGEGTAVPAEAVATVSCPVLLLRGEHSQALTAEGAEQTVRLLAEARMATITGAGHDIGMEQPEQAARAVRGFLD